MIYDVQRLSYVLETYVDGQMAGICTKHDGSRVVQFCITNGSAEQRSTIAKVGFTCPLH